jgi:hypothetical protein
MVTGGADAPVIAGRRVEGVNTPDFRGTGIGGADILVVTGQGGAGRALPGLAAITYRTRITVIAGGGHGVVKALPFCRAGILGARVGVITIDCFAGDADTRLAGIIARTRVTITAGTSDRGVKTPFGRGATIHSAGVVVGARQVGLSGAESIGTTVSQGTGVIVVTGPLSRGMDTANVSLTAILGARVEVITGGQGTGHASTATADIRERAEVAVIAGHTIIH